MSHHAILITIDFFINRFAHQSRREICAQFSVSLWAIVRPLEFAHSRILRPILLMLGSLSYGAHFDLHRGVVAHGSEGPKDFILTSIVFSERFDPQRSAGSSRQAHLLTEVSLAPIQQIGYFDLKFRRRNRIDGRFLLAGLYRAGRLSFAATFRSFRQHSRFV